MYSGLKGNNQKMGMRLTGKKGQAEIMDGLILMLISAICSVVLLSISSSYGSLPVKIYEETYSQKLAQNTLLSLYHITDRDQSSEFYRKSIMIAVSKELSGGSTSIRGTEGGNLIKGILDAYYTSLGRHFMFALTDGVNLIPASIVSTDDAVVDDATFKQRAGNSYCASAALTYPPGAGGCIDGNSAGSMCYQVFEVCTWLA